MTTGGSVGDIAGRPPVPPSPAPSMPPSRELSDRLDMLRGMLPLATSTGEEFAEQSEASEFEDMSRLSLVDETPLVRGR